MSEPDKRRVSVDDMTNEDIEVTHILIQDGQLRMYKYFERILIANSGQITLEEYQEQIKPAVRFLREELAAKIATIREKLKEQGLYKEE